LGNAASHPVCMTLYLPFNKTSIMMGGWTAMMAFTMYHAISLLADKF